NLNRSALDAVDVYVAVAGNDVLQSHCIILADLNVAAVADDCRKRVDRRAETYAVTGRRAQRLCKYIGCGIAIFNDLTSSADADSSGEREDEPDLGVSIARHFDADRVFVPT